MRHSEQTTFYPGYYVKHRKSSRQTDKPVIALRASALPSASNQPPQTYSLRDTKCRITCFQKAYASSPSPNHTHRTFKIL